MSSFATDFFHLAYCFQGSFMLYVPVLYFFLLTNNIQSYDYIIFNLLNLVHQLMDFGLFLLLGYCQCCYERSYTSFCEFFCEHAAFYSRLSRHPPQRGGTIQVYFERVPLMSCAHGVPQAAC